MTILAGIVRLDGRPLPPGWTTAVLGSISRYAHDVPIHAHCKSFVLAKIDIGALRVDGMLRAAEGGMAMLAGDPVCTLRNDGTDGRLDGLKQLYAAWRRDSNDAVLHSQGSYCAALFDRQSHRLCLIVDKMAVRPIYYAVEDETVFFASALRVLESWPFLKKRLDVTGVAESVAFGFPLGSRTPYSNISSLESGEMLEFSEEGEKRNRYWRWDALKENELSSAERSAEIYARFERAVGRRLKGQRSVVAALSGGLDSRCVVAVLRKLGARVHTINFAPQGTQDLEFGRLAAQALSTDHFEYPIGPGVIGDKQVIAHAAWRKRPQQNEVAVERPNVIWSGDGGSVGVGHVYLNASMVRAARSEGNEVAAALVARVNNYGLPKRLFRPGPRAMLAGIEVRAIRAELDRLSGFDAGRNLHLFFMLNDQRRHLADHFENIDLRRLELELPFFDAEFLESILASPVDPFLSHHFYNEWLSRFSENAASVPWQAYPGHEPCPIDVATTLRYQWRSLYDARDERAMRRKLAEEAGWLLAADRFPHALIRPFILRLARWAILAGRDEYAHVVRASSILVKYWSRCETSAS
jgi:hypothetical protein